MVKTADFFDVDSKCWFSFLSWSFLQDWENEMVRLTPFHVIRVFLYPSRGIERDQWHKMGWFLSKTHHLIEGLNWSVLQLIQIFYKNFLLIAAPYWSFEDFHCAHYFLYKCRVAFWEMGNLFYFNVIFASYMHKQFLIGRLSIYHLLGIGKLILYLDTLRLYLNFSNVL